MATETQAIADRLKHLAECTSEGMWEVTFEGGIDLSLDHDKQVDRVFEAVVVYCNPQFANMYGYTVDEIIDKPITFFLHRDKDNREFIGNWVRSGYQSVNQRSNEHDKNGRQIYFLNTFVGVIETDGDRQVINRAYGTQSAFQPPEGTTSVFGTPSPSALWPKLFVLMPFADELKPIFDDHIKNVVAEFSLEAGRADDFFSVGSIVHEIWSAINGAQIVVADCTGRNPNVFYEIGIAHTLGKDTILMSQSIDDVPFDLRYLRVIIYEYTPRGMIDFEDKLRATLTAILGPTNGA